MDHFRPFSNKQCIFLQQINVKNANPVSGAKVRTHEGICCKRFYNIHLVEVVEILLHRGAHINAKGHQNKSPLHYAIENGHLDAVKILLGYKAKVNSKNKKRETPLHLASSNGHLEIVQFLLEHGANPDAMDINNKTPLHFASANGHHEIAELL